MFALAILHPAPSLCSKQPPTPLEHLGYLADPQYIDNALQPYTWYKELVVHGARAHGFPRAYVDEIAAMPAIADPDQGRAQSHFSLIEAMARDTQLF